MNEDTPTELSGEKEVDAILQADRVQVNSGRLDPLCASFFVRPSSPARGIALMFHGFTAAPWQYRPLAQFLKERQIASFAVRLPGHGALLPSGEEDGAGIPRGHQAALYVALAKEAFLAAHSLAHRMAVPLFVLGFSTGGTLATDLSQRFADKIDKLVLIAPLFRLRQKSAHVGLTLLGLLPGTNAILNRWQMGWREPENKPLWKRPGHARFVLGNVQALVRYGRRIRRRGGLRVPTQFITTDNDKKVDLKACLALMQRAHAQNDMFRFGPAAQVPHAMLTEHENPNEESRQQIYEIIAKFLLTNEGTTGATP